MEFNRRLEYERCRLGLSESGAWRVADTYRLVSGAVMAEISDRWRQDTAAKAKKRCARYFSAEFLMGRAVCNNLLNLHLADQTETYLARFGKSLSDLEEVEDAALGNGGLGRLAACFLDSAATHGIPLDGYGIRYRYGLFKQEFTDGAQKEQADDWTKWGDPWSVRREEDRVRVRLGKTDVYAVPYDMPIVGYGGVINTLRLWQCEPISPFDFEKFDAGNYAGAYRDAIEAAQISAVLYPNDSTEKGRKLRLRQEYFLAAAGIADTVRACKRGGVPLADLDKAAVFQLNDTHPVLAVPELIRVLEHEGLSFAEAFAVAKRCFCYTNHTVMAEAMETWDCRMVRALSAEIYEIIRRIDSIAATEISQRGGDSARTRIIDGGRVHMARLAVFMSMRTNGVAAVHTEILKADTLHDFYVVFPERFHNKTNGVTPRRWLYLCNPDLRDFITERIGEGWITDADELVRLAPYARNAASLDAFRAVKRRNKEKLAAFVAAREGVRIDPDFIFDVQAKRLHEYKRQLLNAFEIVSLYKGLKTGKVQRFTPTVFLFGAKAAPGYRRAKGVIRYIHEVAKLVNNDAEMRGRMQVVFLTDYNVSYAEKLMPAGDVSVQISAVGTEASGTGNMKLMLSGAVTCGTYDGANIEIAAAAGEENNYLFGARPEQMQEIRAAYNPHVYYESDPVLRAAVDTLVDGTFSDGGSGVFRELYDSLLVGASWHRPDQYMLFYDFAAFHRTRLQINEDYTKPDFAAKGLLNTAHAGRFSSDRTVKEYAADTWHV